MSTSVDYGMEYRSVKTYAQLEVRKARKLRQAENRRKRIEQFYDDFPNCYYCSTLLTKANRSLDHFVPKSQDGSSCFENLVTACKYCNNLKGSELPYGMKTVPEELFVKNGKKWKPYVMAREPDAQKIGLASVGHAKAWRLFP